MTLCFENHANGFRHLEVELGERLTERWDLGYRFTNAMGLGPEPPPEFWLQLNVSLRQTPDTQQEISFGLRKPDWTGLMETPSAEDEKVLLERATPLIEAYLKQLENEGHISVPEGPEFL